MTTLDKPLITKARRVGKLEKPAPLKRSLSVNTGTEEKLHSAKHLCAKDVLEVKENIDCNNKETTGLSVNRGSLRKNLKLTKPRPLKKKSDDTISPTENIDAPFTSSDPDCSQEIDTSRSTYLSQMSRDSGIGDMERSESRISQLNSVEEDDVFSPEPVDHNANRFTMGFGDMVNEDDLDWNDLDEPAFVFGHQQLKYTSYAVNQSVPFNSFMQKDSDKSVKSGGRGRGRSKPTSKTPQYVRSRSVPGALSQTQSFRSDGNNNRKEDWESEVDNSVTERVPPNTDKISDMCNNNISKDLERLNEVNNEISHSDYSGNSVQKSNFSEDWESDLMDTGVDRQTDYRNDNIQDKSDIYLSRQMENIVYNHSIQTSVSHMQNNRMKTPEPGESAETQIYSSDVDTTLKASDTSTEMIQPNILTSMFPPNTFVSTYSPSVQRSNVSSVKLGQDSEVSSRSSTPVNVNPQDCVITPVKDPWAAVEEYETSRRTQQEPSTTSYRNRHLDYDTCSSDSKTSDTDTSMTTSDDGFSEQQYAWELIDDLTDQLQDISLKIGSSKRSSVAESDTNPAVAKIPQQRDSVEDVGRATTETESSKVVTSDAKQPVGVTRLLVTRCPLSPHSMLQEIWQVEETQPGGMYSAKGRRKMFRNYAICRELETVEDDTSLIQYTADELLRMGTSPLCKEVPETWSYLTVIYPEVCLKEVTKFFDIEQYREERGYVVENYLVKDLSGHTSNRQGFSVDQRNRQDKSKPFGFQRSISMPTGDGTHSSTSFAVETSSVTENQSGFGSQRHGFGQPGQQTVRQKGFGTPNETVIKPTGFGTPPQGLKKNSLDSAELDTKCDISIKSNGLSKVFSEGGDIINTGYIKVCDTSETEAEDKFPVKSFVRSNSCFSGNRARNYSDLMSGMNRECSNSEEEFYMNRDLPDQCPW